jgi:O-antigen ligase
VAPVTSRPVESARAHGRIAGLGLLQDRASLGAVVLAGAVPFLFLHERFQPEASVGIGSSSLEIRLSDVAVFLVLVAAVVSALHLGAERLRSGRALWLSGAALLIWLTFETLRPSSLDDDRFADHLVSFLKLGEYVLLAVAVPLLVRRRVDLRIFLGALVLWSVVASGVASLQFFGLDIFGAWNAGWRQPSFLGHHDLAALSAIGVSTAAAGIGAGRGRLPIPSLFAVALASGILGLVLAGSIAAAAGLAVGVLALALAARARFAPSPRRLLALAVVVAVVAGGVAAVRGDALEDFLRFLGVRGDEPPQGVETYSQRTVLAYIGFRIFADNPVAGVGWQRSGRADVFEPYVDDARRRFPDVVDLAFPAPGREWGVQNLYVQMAADAGVVGLTLLLAVGWAGLLLAWRAATRAVDLWAAGAGLTALCALLTLAGEWASLGIVSGIPLQAATSLAFGLAAAGAATVEDAAGA